MSEHFDTFLDGEVHPFLVTEEFFEEVYQLLLRRFIGDENICQATDAAVSPDAIEEFKRWAFHVFKERVSIGARHVPSGKLVAVCVNKVLFANDEDSVKIWSEFRAPGKLALVEYLNKAQSVDILKEWDIDSALEVMFMATETEFRGRGIAGELTRLSVELARKLPGNPKAVCAIFTSLFTQKIGSKLGFETLVEIPYTEFEHKGRKYSEKIDPMHETSVFAAIRL